MKAFALLMLLAAVFGVSVLLTSVQLFCDVGPEVAQLLDKGGLAEGHLGCVLGTSALWSQYPAMPPLSSLTSDLGFLLTAPLMVLLLGLGRWRRWHPAVMLVGSLAISCVPYLVGLIALRGSSNSDLSRLGYWLAVMILGPLYCLVACSLLSILVFWKAWRRSTQQAGVLALN